MTLLPFDPLLSYIYPFLHITCGIMPYYTRRSFPSQTAASQKALRSFHICLIHSLAQKMPQQPKKYSHYRNSSEYLLHLLHMYNPPSNMLLLTASFRNITTSLRLRSCISTADQIQRSPFLTTLCSQLYLIICD